jgi:hypothetical protein
MPGVATRVRRDELPMILMSMGDIVAIKAVSVYAGARVRVRVCVCARAQIT